MKKFLLLCALLVCFSAFVHAQTTAFNFQGRLNDGSNPANGRYDLQFLLYDALVGGNQIGPIVTKNNVPLINGVFSTQLDFGVSAFSGGDRFLEIQLRPTAPQSVTPNAFVILGARQQLLSVPYSVKSLNATNASNAQTAVNATNSTNSSALGGVAASNYLQKNGDGSQLTNVTAANSQQLGGVAADQYVQRGGFGTIKAMLYVQTPPSTGNAVILQCYNATLNGSAATTPPCGFAVDNFTVGGYGVNLGFNVSRFAVASTVNNLRDTNNQPVNEPNYATISYLTNNPQTLNVFTWDGSGSITSRPYFTLIVY